jgi:electron transport complex protein RnfE
MKKYLSIFTNGLMRENPLLMLMIGLCSSLAVTTNIANGVGMGAAMTFVLVMSELIISALRRLIPDSIRIPVFIIIIASFTTIVDLVMKAYTPELSRAMGVFIPLIVVNCIIMGRVESFSYKRTVVESAFDALGMGLGYTWVLCAISLIREFLGDGRFFGHAVLPEQFQVKFFSQSPGGFLVFGLLIAFAFAVNSRIEKKGDSK